MEKIVAKSVDPMYTPTIDEVRNNMAFGISAAVVMPALAQNIDWPNPGDRARGKAEFDRWLASHEASVRDAALDEAADIATDEALNAPGRTSYTEGYEDAAFNAASAIRALKEEK